MRFLDRRTNTRTVQCTPDQGILYELLTSSCTVLFSNEHYFFLNFMKNKFNAFLPKLLPELHSFTSSRRYFQNNIAKILM